MTDAPTRQDPADLDRFFADTYRELRRLAHSRLRRMGELSMLDTTALVHEAYLKLYGLEPGSHGQLTNMAYVASTMRSVVVDFVRRRMTDRRGGDSCFVSLDGGDDCEAAAVADAGSASEILEVHQMIEMLAQTEPRLAQVVELRFFGGFTEQEIAAALSVTERTVRRDWEKARLLLRALADQ